MSNQDVKAMYNRYPYPSSAIGDNLIYDMATVVGLIFKPGYLTGKYVLDLGCGTGHRLVGLASMYPDTQFVGIDMTDKALEVADKLISYHRLDNVTLENNTIEQLTRNNQFDVVVSTGVIHHMECPQEGFFVASRSLNEDGIALIWLYNVIGEYERLKQRELLQIFAKQIHVEEYFLHTDLMNKLCKNLSRNQYGDSTANHLDDSVDQIAVNVDAFLNPIVNAYRYDEICDFYYKSGFKRVRCCGLNRENGNKFFAGCCEQFDDEYFLQYRDLPLDEQLSELFNTLDYNQKVRVIELLWKPTGISSIGFKSENALSFVNDWLRVEE
ncbi:class I SAM-dependent methyltransferase [Photorhabdus sp. APURE]|uniref:class I SAM-dependent methyltransferase n=1 Tax=Photorhabdus aballayi TaxID=2991723 RepID=UPI00223DD663|nr:class I SAM-dependent methyltransferase [Photorhabdus aballayi]MCW7548181.1 class I SAM-dependent methyltransferase [Photorhabdus aballayi]